MSRRHGRHVRTLALGATLLACGTGARSESSPAEHVEPLRILVISDLNGRYGSTSYGPEVHRAIDYARRDPRADLVLIAGDLIAGQAPQLPDSVVRAMWAAFDSAVTTPLRVTGIPLVITLGNHDASAYPAHARDRRLAAEYWRGSARSAIATMIDDANFPFRYSVRVEHLFIAAWDGTNRESSTNDTLVTWLRDALASDAARTARHRIVLLHLPLYGVAVGRSQPGEVLADGDELRRKLEAWGATLVVSGHHHAFYPARRGAVELLHSGALGDGPRQLVGLPEAYKALAILELARDSMHIAGFRIDSAGGALEPIALASLPPIICAFGGWVARRDVKIVEASCPR